MSAPSIVQDHAELRGDTWEWDLYIRDANGVPQNIGAVGVEMWYTLKKKLSDADPGALQKKLSTSSAGNGFVVVDATAGHARLTIPASETAALEPRVYDYDIQVRLGASAPVRTLFTGKFTVLADPTRST